GIRDKLVTGVQTCALPIYQRAGTIQSANVQLGTLLNAALRRVLGEVTFTQVVRDERESLMRKIRDQLDREADAYGIQVVDVRIQIGRASCRERGQGAERVL